MTIANMAIGFGSAIVTIGFGNAITTFDFGNAIMTIAITTIVFGNTIMTHVFFCSTIMTIGFWAFSSKAPAAPSEPLSPAHTVVFN